MRRATVLSVSLALCWWTAGCDGDAGAATDAGTAVRDAGADAGPPVRPSDFACLGSVVWPLAPAASLTAPMRFYRPPAWLGGADYAPFAGLRVQVCAAGTDCVLPSDVEGSATTDAVGDAILTLATPGTGFDGYLYATPPSPFVSMRMWLYPPIADRSSIWLDPVHEKVVLDPAAIERVHGGSWTYDPSRATVIATTLNCVGGFSEAPFVTLDDAAPFFRLAADSVWFDVPPGPAVLVATLPETGEEMARIPVQARAGEITAVNFGPMPR